MPETASRFIIGIDLGTTNSAVAYVDTSEGPDIRAFPIPQLTAPGEIRTDSLLPSFLYIPGDHELPPGALKLPWHDDTGEHPVDASPALARSRQKRAVGIFAREQGTLVPGRLVSSAKSWLAHGGVDRTAAILPWGCELGESAVSPVQASAAYLEHIRKAWDHRFGSEKDEHGTPCLMAEQNVVLTVPASFDEAARELTVEAARRADLERVTLLEEPLAAFYGWLSRRENSWQKSIGDNEAILIVDVGGGTTDFSLIEVKRGHQLQRTAVGDHLLLGGDNMDMALARSVESEWAVKLGQREWSALVHQCRQAKERLLDRHGPETCQLSVSSAGKSLIAGTRTAELHRAEVAESLLDGFFPAVSTDVQAPAKRAGLRQMGLPYVADPAVTRHLAAFLKNAANVTVPERVGANGFASPTRILFNGGSLLPETIRRRICATVAALTGQETVAELHTDDLTRAVAAGAAFYGRVRRGEGVRVSGGIARSYFIEIASPHGPRFLCIMPRDRQENEPVKLVGGTFRMATNQTVQFRLFSSSTRLGDQPGDLLEHSEGLAPLPPLQTLVRYGKKARVEAEVSIEATLNETGTLDICCATVDGHHQFPLRFNLRAEDKNAAARIPTEQTLAQALLTGAESAISNAFDNKKALPGLFKYLENILELPRAEWGALLLRRLADMMLKAPGQCAKSPEHEARWLNLTGFLMRPGFGVPGDDARMAQLWKLWHAGPRHANKTQVLSEWWILWRRLAGGLREGHQQQIAGQLFKALTGEGGTPVLDLPGAAGQILREQWRCLAALERIPVKRKSALLKKLAGQPAPAAHYFWVIARLGARKLLHGPENSVVPAKQIEPVAAYLTTLPLPADPQACRLLGLALLSTCTLCGIRNFEVPETLRQAAAERLHVLDMPDSAEQLFLTGARSHEQEEAMLGDDLPLGLEIKSL